MATEVDRLDGRLQGPVWREREGRGRRGVGLLWAGVLVLLVAAGAAIYVATRGGGEGEVPMILADGSPLRVRPAEPGGYRVPNQDIEAYPGARSRQREGERRVEVLLPPPEEPKPLPRPAPPSPAAAPAHAAAPPIGEPPATAAASTATPPDAAVRPASAPPTTVAPPAPPPRTAPPEAPRPAPATPAAGSVSVQLAAVTAEAQVQPEIARLRARLAQELGSRPLAASRIDRDGRPLWRIRAGGFPDEASARAFCETVRAKGMGCLVVSGS